MQYSSNNSYNIEIQYYGSGQLHINQECCCYDVLSLWMLSEHTFKDWWLAQSLACSSEAFSKGDDFVSDSF